MDVSIIIVNYNSIDLTIDCVNSIFQQTADVKFEIIIVDNASKNKEAERLQAEFENSVKMIEAKINLGFGKANNLGTKYAAGDYVFFLNPDTVLMNNAVKILWEEMKNNPDMGCIHSYKPLSSFQKCLFIESFNTFTLPSVL